MQPTLSTILKYEMPDDESAYLDHQAPFELLEISTAGKSIPELYRELNSLAADHFLEYCYLSKKNYTYDQFRTTNFYKRYIFLKKHFDELSYWLYKREENLPRNLLTLIKEKPNYDNPWGVRAHSKTLEFRKIFKRKE